MMFEMQAQELFDAVMAIDYGALALILEPAQFTTTQLVMVKVQLAQEVVLKRFGPVEAEATATCSLPRLSTASPRVLRRSA